MSTPKTSTSMKFILVGLITSILISLLAVSPASAAVSVVYTPQGDIIINGDNGDQFVEVQTRDDGWEIIFRSVNNDRVFVVPELRRDFIVNLRNGDDVLFMDLEVRMPVPRNVNINLGNGQNFLDGSGGFSVGGNLKVQDGTGSSRIELWNSDVAGTSLINLGNGTHAVESLFNRFEGPYRFTTGANGDAAVEIEKTTFNGPVNMRTGNRVDSFLFGEEVVFNGRTTLIDLRGGNDDLTMRERPVLNTRADLRMGSGNDRALLLGATSDDRFSFRGDAGDDDLILTANTFASTVTLNGGANNDRLSGEANSFARTPRVISFESQG